MLQDPDALRYVVEWHHIKGSETTYCAEYRAKNHLGGYTDSVEVRGVIISEEVDSIRPFPCSSAEKEL